LDQNFDRVKRALMMTNWKGLKLLALKVEGQVKPAHRGEVNDW
jgi:hypothetical protein